MNFSLRNLAPGALWIGLWVAILGALFPVPGLADTPVQTHSIIVDAAPVLDTGAYLAGELAGGKLTFSDAGRQFVGSGRITGAQFVDIGAEAKDVQVVVFDTDPSSTTFTDQAAFDPADADLVNIVCVIDVTSHVSFNDNGISSGVPAGPCRFYNATTLYGALVIREGVTYDSAAAGTVRLHVSQD